MRLAPLATLVVVSLVSRLALAQAEAGGYSAGTGLAAPTPVLVEADGGAVLFAPDAGLADAGIYETTIAGHRSPSFTQDREFATTRMWVLDPGKFTVEQWWTGNWGATRASPNDYPNDHFFQTELEVGIAPHLQLDVYGNFEFNQNETGQLQTAVGGHTGVAVEMRVALGNYWGQIPGNPTLYFEITSQYYNSPRGEVRLLLGDTLFTPRLLGAINLLFERNLFRDASSGIDYEIKANVGLNYEVVPGILRLGVEGVFGWDSHGTVDAQGHALLHPVIEVGPGLLLTEPGKRIKLLAALLHGFSETDQPWVSTLILSTTFEGWKR